MRNTTLYSTIISLPKGSNSTASHSSAFIQSGISDGWKTKFSREDANLIWHTHQDVMRNIGNAKERQP
jgi:hypothetical protein